MPFTIHTGLKLTPFDLHNGRKPRTKLTKMVEDGKSFLSDCTELSVSPEKKKTKNPNLRIVKRRGGCNKLSGFDKNKSEKAKDKPKKKILVNK